MRSIFTASAADIHLLFPTPLLARYYPDLGSLNADLKGYIADCAAREPHLARSARHGWQSALDFLDRQRPSIAELRARIESAIGEVSNFAIGEQAAQLQPQIASSWANMLRDGGYHKLHAHRNNAWAGVYYVAVPQEQGDPDAGVIEFPDPRGAATMVTPDQFGLMLSPRRVKPREGMLLIFPAWLPHFVNPHRGSEPRMAVSFNAALRTRPTSEARG